MLPVCEAALSSPSVCGRSTRSADALLRSRDVAGECGARRTIMSTIDESSGPVLPNAALASVHARRLFSACSSEAHGAACQTKLDKMDSDNSTIRCRLPAHCRNSASCHGPSSEPCSPRHTSSWWQSNATRWSTVSTGSPSTVGAPRNCRTISILGAVAMQRQKNSSAPIRHCCLSRLSWELSIMSASAFGAFLSEMIVGTMSRLATARRAFSCESAWCTKTNKSVLCKAT
mmetsp:Transcript_115385/g.230079  ORF Transcript_115385/g.230079 Transcript_115385/m.230079 type:complete len:231 (-) Transcript_115385:1303-1995(-)